MLLCCGIGTTMPISNLRTEFAAVYQTRQTGLVLPAADVQCSSHTRIARQESTGKQIIKLKASDSWVDFSSCLIQIGRIK